MEGNAKEQKLKTRWDGGRNYSLQDTNTREFHSNNLRAVGPNHTQLYTSVEDETEQKTRQQNKT